jgi:toxin ParE1/3/4
VSYQVVILDEAEEDIFSIYCYILKNDSPLKAEFVFGKVEELCNGLQDLPNRGHIPPELERVGMSLYREIHFKPYRIIYEIDGKIVFIHCVVDGRRDLQQLLERRLVRP